MRKTFKNLLHLLIEEFLLSSTKTLRDFKLNFSPPRKGLMIQVQRMIPDLGIVPAACPPRILLRESYIQFNIFQRHLRLL